MRHFFENNKVEISTFFTTGLSSLNWYQCVIGRHLNRKYSNETRRNRMIEELIKTKLLIGIKERVLMNGSV